MYFNIMLQTAFNNIINNNKGSVSIFYFVIISATSVSHNHLESLSLFKPFVLNSRQFYYRRVLRTIIPEAFNFTES